MSSSDSIDSPIVPPDDESIYAALVSLAAANPVGYQAIVRPNNPPPGIGGYLMDIPGEEEIRLQSKITNYFLERNSSIQDSWALMPITITLRGTVAELTMGLPLVPPVVAIDNQLPLLPAMEPMLTANQLFGRGQAATQQQIVDTQEQNAAAASGTSPSLYQFYQSNNGNNGSITRQSAAFLYFKNLWSGQQLCSVETPWGIVENCAILDCRAVQSEKTRDQTEFTITFQEVRFAGEAVVQVGNLAGRTALQMTPQQAAGNASQVVATPQQNAAAYSNFGVGIQGPFTTP
jgi:hypothetical protein